ASRMVGQEWLAMAVNYFTRLVQSDAYRQGGNVWGLLTMAKMLQTPPGDVQQASAQRPEARDAAGKGLQLKGDEPRALAVRGTVRVERGDAEGAIKDFDSALKQPDRQNYLAAIGRALALEQLKQFEPARAAYEVVATNAAAADWQKETG